MKIIVKENADIQETIITINCHQKDADIQQITDYLSQFYQTLTCKKDKHIYQIYIKDIYYIESVDDKTFIYVQNEFYECTYKLYELESLLKEHDLIRISKSCLLNLRYLESVKVLVYGKYEATLINHEKLIISRKYMPAFKKAFGL